MQPAKQPGTFARAFIALLAAIVVSSPAAPATAASSEPPPQAGHVILARTGGDALLIWDASADVATIVTDKVSDADADARLQRDGLRVLAASLGKLDATAKTVTLRIIYNKTGAVSPVYNAATLADVERYAILSAAADGLRENRDKWRDAQAGKALPSWITFKVTGRLPPR